MDEAPIPTPYAKPLNDSYSSLSNSRKKNLKETEEKILEFKEYILTKDDKKYKLSINKTGELLLIRALNYENRITYTEIAKMTKILIDNNEDAYKFITNMFDDKKVIINDIEKNKLIKLKITIYDFSGKERPFEINLLYNSENKDYIINELSDKCYNLEEEVTKLKNEIKEMKDQIKDLYGLKGEINYLKSFIKEKGEIINKNNNTNEKSEDFNEKEKQEKNDLVPSDPKDIELIEILSNTSYSDWGLDNIFTVFESVEKSPYLVYTNKEKDLIFYNINDRKIINQIKKAHDCFITNINHLYDLETNKNIIMTVSADNNNIKLWELNKSKNILNMKNINKKSLLLSACFLNYENKNYIVTSNGDLTATEFEPIKLYDFKGKKFLEIKKSNYNTNVINTFYDKEKSNYYIISGNDGFVSAYNIKENSNPMIFKEPKNNKSHRSLVVISSENIKKLIESCDDGNIRIWNFYTKELIKKINLENPLRGICPFNDNFIFIGSKDKTIKLINIKEGKILKSIKEHNNTVLALKLINIAKYGRCLVTQGNDEDVIILWKINYN